MPSERTNNFPESGRGLGHMTYNFWQYGRLSQRQLGCLFYTECYLRFLLSVCMQCVLCRPYVYYTVVCTCTHAVGPLWLVGCVCRLFGFSGLNNLLTFTFPLSQFLMTVTFCYRKEIMASNRVFCLHIFYNLLRTKSSSCSVNCRWYYCCRYQIREFTTSHGFVYTNNNLFEPSGQPFIHYYCESSVQDATSILHAVKLSSVWQINSQYHSLHTFSLQAVQAAGLQATVNDGAYRCCAQFKRSQQKIVFYSLRSWVVSKKVGSVLVN